jgi:hypothetical protein
MSIRLLRPFHELLRSGYSVTTACEWEDFLATKATEDHVKALRRHERSGRRLGREHVVRTVARKLGRTLRHGKPGPKRRRAE